MYTFLLVLDVLVAVALIALVLVQQGKGADAGAAFGSGASGTVFGSRGSANFLTRATAVCATFFFAISLSLAYMVQAQRTGESVMERLGAQQETVDPSVRAGPDEPAQRTPQVPE
jgi:preprotein translocase subunit SecG